MLTIVDRVDVERQAFIESNRNRQPRRQSLGEVCRETGSTVVGRQIYAARAGLHVRAIVTPVWYENDAA